MARKSFAVLFLVIPVIFMAAFAASNYADDVIERGVSIRITLQSQEPDPSQPGSSFVAKFKVENIGGTPADDFVLDFVPEYPFSLYSGESERELGNLGSYGDNAAIVSYVLKLDQNAVEGTAKLKLRFKYTGSSSWVTREFSINIRTYDAIMLYDEIEVPAAIAPGATAEIKVSFQNFADSLLKNIKAKLDFSDSALPFGPVNSLGEASIFKLNPKEKRALSFQVRAKSDAESNLYKIPLTLTYEDSVGTNYTKSGYVSLTVGDVPDISLFLTEGTLYEKTQGKITLQIVNKGLASVKFVTIRLNPSDEYDLISPDEIYIGVIDSDDFETADFTIYPKSDKAGLSLTLDFSDSDNNKFTKEYSKTLKVYSSSEAKKLGLKAGGYTGTIIFVIVIVAGILIYRRYVKKKAR